MVKNAVDNAKFVILLVLVAAFFLGAGYYAAKITRQTTSPASSASQVTQSTIQVLLDDKALSDPANKFTDFRPGAYFTHSIRGRVIDVTLSTFTILADNKPVTVSKLQTTLYFLEGKTASIATSKALQIGATATVSILTDAKTYKPSALIIKIAKL